MIDVLLSEEDEAKAAAAAAAVNANKDRIGKPNTAWKPGQDPLKMRRDSFRAELAVARFLGLDLEWEILDGGDDKIDIHLPHPVWMLDDGGSGVEAKTVQVKHRGERRRDLATDGLGFFRELKADIYVLAWPAEEGDAITLVGWCTRRDFFNRITSRAPIRMLGDKYEMKWETELRDMRDLLGEWQAACWLVEMEGQASDGEEAPNRAVWQNQGRQDDAGAGVGEAA